MKLYHFNPNDYGQEAFVMAESPDEAKKYLSKKKLPVKMVKAMYDYPDYDQNRFQNETIDDMIDLKQKYTLDEYNIGEVVFSEIA